VKTELCDKIGYILKEAKKEHFKMSIMMPNPEEEKNRFSYKTYDDWLQ